MNKDLIGITEHCDPTVDLQWVKWVNKNRPAIIITKNPVRLISLINSKMNIIIHSTITGLGGTVFEPNIPPYQESLIAYHQISNLIGKNRVVLRIDPIIDNLDIMFYQDLIKESEGRVRISFLDLYPHVLRRFKDNEIKFKRTEFHLPLRDRVLIWELLNKPEICGELDMDVTPCVSELDCKILGVNPYGYKGQRFACACLGNKRELLTMKCTYNCLYCYWK